MKEISYKDENGNTMNISVMGYFKIPELEKEFVMYSLMDDNSSNEDGYTLLGEVVYEDGFARVLGIESSEKEMVVAYYNEISEQIGGSEDE